MKPHFINVNVNERLIRRKSENETLWKSISKIAGGGGAHQRRKRRAAASKRQEAGAICLLGLEGAEGAEAQKKYEERENLKQNGGIAHGKADEEEEINEEILFSKMKSYQMKISEEIINESQWN